MAVGGAAAGGVGMDGIKSNTYGWIKAARLQPSVSNGGVPQTNMHVCTNGSKMTPRLSDCADQGQCDVRLSAMEARSNVTSRWQQSLRQESALGCGSQTLTRRRQRSSLHHLHCYTRLRWHSGARGAPMPRTATKATHHYHRVRLTPTCRITLYHWSMINTCTVYLWLLPGGT
jgi:hypothetical protein